MLFTLNVSSSYFDVKNIGYIPSIRQILQDNKLITLIPDFVSLGEMTQPSKRVLLVLLLPQVDLRISIKLQHTKIFRNVSAYGCEGMRNVIR